MARPPCFLNDGTHDAPKLRVYLNLDNLADPADGFSGPRLDDPERDAKLAADGFEGVQLTNDDATAVGGVLPFCGLDRINTPAEAEPVVTKHRERGDQCITVHVGCGLEDDSEVFRLVEAILSASSRHRLPVFIETHRATITQDLWRTVQITRHFPEVRFNGDFSHYYCGQEMVYGGLGMKLEFMRPIFDRIAFIHGRIASPGCMQVPIDVTFGRPRMAHGEVDYFADFRKIWTMAMEGFLRAAGRGDVLVFCPELLSGRHYYARLFPDGEGRLNEEIDRYAQALLYGKVARECFEAARVGAVRWD